jgi:TPR repeat protein
MYEVGNGVARDSATSVEWYQKVENLGHVEAQYSLSVMYGDGTGVAKDEAAAADGIKRQRARHLLKPSPSWVPSTSMVQVYRRMRQ